VTFQTSMAGGVARDSNGNVYNFNLPPKGAGREVIDAFKDDYLKKFEIKLVGENRTIRSAGYDLALAKFQSEIIGDPALSHVQKETMLYALKELNDTQRQQIIMTASERRTLEDIGMLDK